jgi:hypothetical protein
MQENIGHHLWVSKKVAGMNALLINIIEEMYPELYQKLNSILNIKDTKIKKLI